MVYLLTQRGHSIEKPLTLKWNSFPVRFFFLRDSFPSITNIVEHQKHSIFSRFLTLPSCSAVISLSYYSVSNLLAQRLHRSNLTFLIPLFLIPQFSLWKWIITISSNKCSASSSPREYSSHLESCYWTRREGLKDNVTDETREGFIYCVWQWRSSSQKSSSEKWTRKYDHELDWRIIASDVTRTSTYTRLSESIWKHSLE